MQIEENLGQNEYGLNIMQLRNISSLVQENLKKHEAGHLGEDFGPETEKAWQRIDAEFLDSMMSDMLKYMRYRF